MNWLTGNWHTHLPVHLANTLLVLVAVACGAIIGSEREKREKPAGLRTLILVCLGSTLFTMASLIFNTATGDSGRVAAQIVTGIGFLGAGAILHGRESVSGMTTAASIWIVAAIGVIVGSGYAGPALGASVLVRIILVVTSRIETHVLLGMQERDVELDYEPSEGRTRVRMERILAAFHVPPTSAQWSDGNGRLAHVKLCLHLPYRHLCDLLDQLVSIPEVKAVRDKV